MGKPKCRAFRLLRYFHRSPLSLSRPLPLPPPGRLDRSVFHVTQLPRRAYHPYIFAKLWTRSFPSFANVSNILFTEYILFSFFPSFFYFFFEASKNVNIESWKRRRAKLQIDFPRIYVESLIPGIN